MLTPIKHPNHDTWLQVMTKKRKAFAESKCNSVIKETNYAASTVFSHYKTIATSKMLHNRKLTQFDG